MSEIDPLTRIYDEYLEKVCEARSKAKPTDGLFGLTSSIADNPCHGEFYEIVGEECRKIAEMFETGQSEQDSADISDSEDAFTSASDSEKTEPAGSGSENAEPAGSPAACVSFLLLADQKYDDMDAVWMVRAAEGHALTLIPCLKPEEAAEILRRYDKKASPRLRFPVQKQVAKALAARSRGKLS